MQVYRPLYDADVYKNGKMFYLRPLHMFNETVVWEEKTTLRFTKITDPAVVAELRSIKERMYQE